MITSTLWHLLLAASLLSTVAFTSEQHSHSNRHKSQAHRSNPSIEECAIRMVNSSWPVPAPTRLFAGRWRLAYHRAQLWGPIHLVMQQSKLDQERLEAVFYQNRTFSAQFNLLVYQPGLALINESQQNEPARAVAPGAPRRAIFKYEEDGAQLYILKQEPLVVYEFGPEPERWNSVWAVYERVPVLEKAQRAKSHLEAALEAIECVQRHAPEPRPVRLHEVKNQQPEWPEPGARFPSLFIDEHADNRNKGDAGDDTSKEDEEEEASETSKEYAQVSPVQQVDDNKQQSELLMGVSAVKNNLSDINELINYRSGASIHLKPLLLMAMLSIASVAVQLMLH